MAADGTEHTKCTQYVFVKEEGNIPSMFPYDSALDLVADRFNQDGSRSYMDFKSTVGEGIFLTLPLATRLYTLRNRSVLAGDGSHAHPFIVRVERKGGVGAGVATAAGLAGQPTAADIAEELILRLAAVYHSRSVRGTPAAGGPAADGAGSAGVGGIGNAGHGGSRGAGSSDEAITASANRSNIHSASHSPDADQHVPNASGVHLSPVIPNVELVSSEGHSLLEEPISGHNSSGSTNPSGGSSRPVGQPLDSLINTHWQVFEDPDTGVSHAFQIV